MVSTRSWTGTALLSSLENIKSAAGDLQEVLGDLGPTLEGSFSTSVVQRISQLSENFRGLTRDLRSLQSAARTVGFGGGAVGAAGLSAAHSQLTGMGRGGGYAGGSQRGAGLSGRAAIFTSALLSPNTSIPRAMAGGASKLADALPGPLKVLSPFLKAAGVVGGAATGLGLRFAKGVISQSMNARPAFEEATRFLSPNMSGSIGSLGGALQHGYGAQAAAAHRESMMRAVGGGRMFTTEKIGKGRGIETIVESLSNRFRQSIGVMTDVMGVLRSGNMDLTSTNAILQKINASVVGPGGKGSPGYIHRGQEQLSMVRGFAANQVGLTGAVNPMQIAGAAGMMNRLMTQFSPSQAGAITNQLSQGLLNPGGGEAGELFMMRAMGFANPMMERYKEVANTMGLDPSQFRRRNLFEYARAMEDPTTRIRGALVGLKAEFGDRTDIQGWILKSLIPGLGFTKAEGIMKAFAGGTGLGEDELRKLMDSGALGLDPISKDKTTGGTNLEYIRNIEGYHNTLLKVGGSDGLRKLHDLLRELQTWGAKGTGKAVTVGIGAMESAFKKASDAASWTADKIETLGDEVEVMFEKEAFENMKEILDKLKKVFNS